MTTPTPADAVRAAIDALRHATDEEIAATTTRVLAGVLLPRPATGDQSMQADRDRLLLLQFLELANELAGNPPPAASREALAEAREGPFFLGSEPVPYSAHDLRQRWSAQNADSWDGLELYEQLAFAQAQAIAADRGRTAQAAETTSSRLRHCATHGQQGPEAWGCPECVRELRAELATTREALRRLVAWGGFRSPSAGYSADVVLGVANWFSDGMTGPLPPLPPYIASRDGLDPAISAEAVRAAVPLTAETIKSGPFSEHDLRQLWNAQSEEEWCELMSYQQLAFAQTQAIEADRRRAEPATSAPALPPALVLDGGDGVVIEAANRERTSWAVRDDLNCLNFSGEWESEPYPSSRDADFLARTRWPSAEAAWAALLEYRAGKGVEG